MYAESETRLSEYFHSNSGVNFGFFYVEFYFTSIFWLDKPICTVQQIIQRKIRCIRSEYTLECIFNTRQSVLSAVSQPKLDIADTRGAVNNQLCTGK